ncbi:MAG: cob(I)yrinic acid a,c-diamide adenosyltransferase [Lachnospiraceae bacterium]|nr:cob(I)yrinic acid a,c-diamide adenosyltransferase [Lachnospiraceae bacterium]
MVQIYCGDGKGKTTAATGLALRAVGSGIPVLFGQFLKDTSSAEILVMRELKEISLFHAKKNYGFTWEMTEEEKLLQKEANDELLLDVEKNLQDYLKDKNCEAGDIDNHTEKQSLRAVVVLDEVLHAVNNNLLSAEILYDFLDKYSGNNEIILTGTNPSEKLVKRADYISEIKKIKHPFDKGMRARKGIEY